MSDKLSRAMLGALHQMQDHYGSQRVKFNTGEALRKRGLCARLSTYVVRREYVEREHTTQQFPEDISAKNPVVWHEWYITADGKRALTNGEL